MSRSERSVLQLDDQNLLDLKLIHWPLMASEQAVNTTYGVNSPLSICVTGMLHTQHTQSHFGTVFASTCLMLLRYSLSLSSGLVRTELLMTTAELIAGFVTISQPFHHTGNYLIHCYHKNIYQQMQETHQYKSLMLIWVIPNLKHTATREGADPNCFLFSMTQS